MRRFGAQHGRTTWHATVAPIGAVFAAIAIALASAPLQAAPSASDTDAARELMAQGRKEQSRLRVMDVYLREPSGWNQVASNVCLHPEEMRGI